MSQKNLSQHPVRKSYDGDAFGNFTDDRGKYFMVRCVKCEAENYMPAVATGTCAWCGHVGSGADVPRDEKPKEKVYGRKPIKVPTKRFIKTF